MKSLSTGYKDHIALSNTTLALLVKIVRKDGTIYLFTDADKEIEYGGETYLPTNAFIPTDFQSSASLSVDNLDITGIISEIDGITEEDIYREFFYDAKIWTSRINYKDTASGVEKLLYGSLGETVLQENKYIAEFRNLTYILTNKLANVFSKTCRVELGSTKCGVDIEPVTWQPNTKYCEGAAVSSGIYDGYRYITSVPGYSNSIGKLFDTVLGEYSPSDWWKLNDSTGATTSANYGSEVVIMRYDDAGASSPVLEDTGVVPKLSDTSADFNGTNQAAIGSNNNSGWAGNGTRWTVFAWVNQGAAESGGSVYSTSSENGNYYNYWSSCEVNGYAEYQRYNNGTNQVIRTTRTDLNDGNPHLIVWTGDGVTKERIYVDGVEETTTIISGSYNQYGFYTIGEHSIGVIQQSTGWTHWFEGNIGHVGTFKNRTLSSAEIYNLYTAGTQNYDYENTVKSATPTAFWRLGDSVGTTAVDAMGSYNGTYVGSPTLQTTGLLTNDANTAVTLNGTSQYISTAYSGILGTNAWSIEAWIQCQPKAKDSQTIVMWGSNAAVGNLVYFALDYDSTGTLPGRLRVGVSGAGQYYDAKDLRDGNPHHVVATCPSSGTVNDIILYVDGVPVTTTLVGTGTTAMNILASQNVTIGYYALTGVNYFEGVIDEVAMYSSTLTSNQIKTNYLRGYGLYEPNWGATTVESSGLTWTRLEAYKRQGAVHAAKDFRFYIHSADSSVGGFAVEEVYFYDVYGSRHYPASCVSASGAATSCSNLSDGTTSDWRFNSTPVTDKWVTFTFTDAFPLEKIVIDVTSTSYITSFDFEYSIDAQATWNMLESFSGGSNQYWRNINDTMTLTDFEYYSTARFILAGDTYADMDYIIDGVITWITGDNTGLSMEVKDYNSTTKEVKLFKPMAYPIKFGDTFYVVPGCNHLYLGSAGTVATGHCASRFNNAINFQGEPFVPTEDVLVGGIGETNKEGYID